MSFLFQRYQSRFMSRANLSHCIAFIIFACVMLAAYLTLSRGLPGAFLIDDNIRIVIKDIPNLKSTTLIQSIESTDVGLFGRPLSLLSLFFTKYLYGNDPAPFKYENILLHLITGLLLFWFLYRLLSSPRLAVWTNTEARRLGLAGIATTFWLLHPLHVSTVLYAVQRMTILSTLFTIAALLSYIVGRHAELARIRGILSVFILVPLFSILAALSKEDAALIPIYILVIEVLAFGFWSNSQRERHILIVSLSVLVLIPIIVGTVYLFTHLESLLYDYAIRDFDLSERIATQSVIVWRYVFLLLTPQLSEMSLYHDSITSFTLTSPSFLLATACWIAVALLALRAYERHPIITFGIALYLSSHLIESTFIPLELMFEHRNYFGSIGLFLVVSYLLMQLWDNYDKGPVIAASTVIILAALLSFQTSTRAYAWKDEEKLLMVTLDDHPESDRAASALANIRLLQGRLNEAQKILQSAVDRPPHQARIGLRLHLLGTYCEKDAKFPPELHMHILGDLEQKPMPAYALSGLNAIKELKRLGRCPGLTHDSLIPLFKAAALNPYGRKHRFRANFLAARYFTQTELYPEAITTYQRALDYRSSAPDSATVRVLIDLADIQIHMNQLNEAKETIATAQELVDSSFFNFQGAQIAIENQKRTLEELKSSPPQ